MGIIEQNLCGDMGTLSKSELNDLFDYCVIVENLGLNAFVIRFNTAAVVEQTELGKATTIIAHLLRRANDVEMMDVATKVRNAIVSGVTGKSFWTGITK